VGVICADLSLSFPDFRAGEKTFQLLAQVSGRAGRGETPGKVILQTYNPDHFSVRTASAQDVKAFYRKEIAFRKSLDYPPFSRMIQIKLSGKDKRQTERVAAAIGDDCSRLQKGNHHYQRSIDILGPLEAPLTRIARRYRWQILLKGMRAKDLHQFVGRLMTDHPRVFNNRRVRVIIDVDPVSLL
jgi:primosomal protein N' (replication factor Y)